MHVERMERERREENLHEALLRLEGPDTDIDFARLTTKALGAYGERVAGAFLRENGLEIVERNWTCTFGEVDLVCTDEQGIVLAEVKTRRSWSFADDVAPELAVDNRKRSKYERLALVYLAKQARYDSVRFDVLAVQMPNAHEARVRHLLAAYEWDR